MRFRTASLTLGASLLLTCHASAQTIDCACEGIYSVGDRVIALVDDPSNSSGIPAGTAGTVICGEDFPFDTLEILVRWDGFSSGSEFNVDSCNCPTQPGGSGTTADWFVACNEIELFTPVTNITQGTDHITIAEGVAGANPGDVLELDAHTFVERNLNVTGLTIRGQGADQTVVDGGGVPGTIFIIDGGNRVTTIESLTIQNGIGNDQSGAATAGAILARVTTAHVRDCVIQNNGPNVFPGDAAVLVEFASMRLESCIFRGNEGQGIALRSADVAVSGNTGHLVAIQCLFDGRGRTLNSAQIQATFQAPTADLINCTFVGVIQGTDNIRVDSNSIVRAVNCVFDGGASKEFGGGTPALISRCLYPGASGDNIDGVPTFVDVTNGDFRLVAGSLGLDAADFDAYAAVDGAITDLAASARLRDDGGTSDTGFGVVSFLDIGAYEFQGASTPPGTCPGDINGDGRTDLSDFNILGINFGCDAN